MKRLLVILLALAVVLSFAGCSKLESLVTFRTPDGEYVWETEKEETDAAETAPTDGAEAASTDGETTSDPLAYQEDEEHELPRIPFN